VDKNVLPTILNCWFSPSFNGVVQMGKKKHILSTLLALMLAATLVLQPISSAYGQEKADTDNTAQATDQIQPTKPKTITPKATTEHYLDLPQYAGSHTVTGTVTSSISTYPTVASFENGKILAHAQGIADVTLTMQNGDIDIYHISSYYQYPQPKLSVVTSNGDNKRLSKWAKFENTDYITDTVRISDGDLLTVLHRAADQTDSID
jgi:hypothetical protein